MKIGMIHIVAGFRELVCRRRSAVSRCFLPRSVVLGLLLLAGCGREGELHSEVPSAAPAADAVILIGAGDIASCKSTGDEATAALLDRFPEAIVFTTGDHAYPDGTAEEFQDCYHPSWGRHRDRTRPAPGNHDYRTENAEAYFRYFGSGAGEPGTGYYSYEHGAWHIIVLNSVLPVHRGSAQERWLREELARTPRRCTLAYWHHPRFSSGKHGSYDSMQPLWEALYDAGAEIVLAGHDHIYERFAMQTPDGRLDTERGIRQFTIGVGGSYFYSLGEVVSHSEARNNETFGVLKLTLREDGYDWEFIPAEHEGLKALVLDEFTDSGTGICH